MFGRTKNQPKAMSSFQIEATYEDGVLKPVSPLPIKDFARVFVTVEAPEESQTVTSDEAERIVRRSYGMLAWTGDAETLRRIAEDPEFDWLER